MLVLLDAYFKFSVEIHKTVLRGAYIILFIIGSDGFETSKYGSKVQAKGCT